MLGYYKQDALTAQTIRDGWLHTGDLGYLSGGELFVCGRAKDIIIVNGRKYHPQDLEWAVDALGGVRRGRVVAFGAIESGQADRVVIVVEPSGTVPAEVLTETIRRRDPRSVRTLRGRRGDRAKRNGGTHHQRKGAARRDQGALRAGRARRRAR